MSSKCLPAAALLSALALLPFAVRAPYLLHIGVLVLLQITVALSLNLMLRIGQLTLAHGAFFGLGAYASALLVMRVGLPFPVAFIAAGIAAAIPALLLGPVFLRIKGVYFALLTFGLGQVVNLIFQEWVSLFGGNNGLFGIPKPDLFGLRLTTPRDFYLFCLVLAAAAYFGVAAIYRSNVGAIIDALEESETLGRSFGLNALAWRTAIFALSSFIVGLAGSVYAHYVGIISPEAFTFWVVVDAIAINVLGGAASPLGAVVGALLLVPLPELLRDTEQYQKLLFGMILMASLIFLPSGIVGWWQARRLEARRRRELATVTNEGKVYGARS